MKKIIFLLFVIHYSLFTAQAQWFQLQNPAYTPLYSVFFLNKDTGYVAGGDGGGTGYNPGEILKTTDGGNNWTIIYQDVWQALYSIYFINANKGFACGYGKQNLLFTPNGGSNWSAVNDSTVEGLTQIFFIDTITGYIVGENGIILKTTDSGNKWKIIHKDSTEFLNSVYFINADTGYVVGYGCKLDCSVILITVNGGKTWVIQEIGKNEVLNGVYFTNAEMGYIVGGGDISFIKTIDGGNNWVSTINHEKYGFQSITFTDINTGYVAGSDSVGSLIEKTTNAGETWSIQNIDSSVSTIGRLNSIYFTDANTGYACGLGGIILKTTNGGGAWINEVQGSFFKVQIYPNPVNNILNIEYQISDRSNVIINICDLFGQEVSAIKNDMEEKGEHSIKYFPNNIKCGIYFIKIIYKDGVNVSKFIKD